MTSTICPISCSTVPSAAHEQLIPTFDQRSRLSRRFCWPVNSKCQAVPRVSRAADTTRTYIFFDSHVLPGHLQEFGLRVAEDLADRLVDRHVAPVRLLIVMPMGERNPSIAYSASDRVCCSRAFSSSRSAATSSSITRIAAMKAILSAIGSMESLACTSTQWMVPSNACTRCRIWMTPPVAPPRWSR